MRHSFRRALFAFSEHLHMRTSQPAHLWFLEAGSLNKVFCLSHWPEKDHSRRSHTSKNTEGCFIENILFVSLHDIIKLSKCYVFSKLKTKIFTFWRIQQLWTVYDFQNFSYCPQKVSFLCKLPYFIESSCVHIVFSARGCVYGWF